MTDHFQPADDEIDLLELARTIWDGRWLITFVAAAVFAVGSAYLHVAERTYTITLTAKPVQADEGPSLGGFSGLASLAGISLPSGSSSDFLSFPLMMAAPEVTVRLVDDPVIMQRLFATEWDAQASIWRAPERSAAGTAVRALKQVLTGDLPPDYRKPDAQRLVEAFEEILSTSLDSKSGLLKIVVTHADPEFGQYLALEVFKATDAHFRDSFLTTGANSVEFYKTQLARARAAEHREALARVIASEEQKLMLATRSSYFVADILTGPTASLGPTAPRASMVLALSLVLGLIAGAGIVLLRKAFSKEPVA